jgi:hypothetical protein
VERTDPKFVILSWKLNSLPLHQYPKQCSLVDEVYGGRGTENPLCGDAKTRDECSTAEVRLFSLRAHTLPRGSDTFRGPLKYSK